MMICTYFRYQMFTWKWAKSLVVCLYIFLFSYMWSYEVFRDIFSCVVSDIIIEFFLSIYKKMYTIHSSEHDDKPERTCFIFCGFTIAVQKPEIHSDLSLPFL